MLLVVLAEKVGAALQAVLLSFAVHTHAISPIAAYYTQPKQFFVDALWLAFLAQKFIVFAF
jgi:hypothetical protein